MKRGGELSCANITSLHKLVPEMASKPSKKSLSSKCYICMWCIRSLHPSTLRWMPTIEFYYLKVCADNCVVIDIVSLLQGNPTNEKGFQWSKRSPIYDQIQSVISRQYRCRPKTKKKVSSHTAAIHREDITTSN